MLRYVWFPPVVEVGLTHVESVKLWLVSMGAEGTVTTEPLVPLNDAAATPNFDAVVLVACPANEPRG